MLITRRNFLIGSSAAITALAIAPAITALDSVLVRGVIEPRYRKIYDVVVSNAAGKMPGVQSIKYGICRGEYPLIQIGLHPMASFRWVACPKGELIFRPEDVFRFSVDPSLPDTTLCMHSEDEHGERFAEVFTWNNDRLVEATRMPLDLLPSEPDEENDDA